MSTATLARPEVATGRPGALARPVSYERISKFRVDQAGVSATISRGVDRQAADADECAEAMGLGSVLHFTDNGFSASQFATKQRDDWLALVEHVRSGEATHVLMWVVDRALRTTEDMDTLLAACRAGGAVIVQTASHTVADPHNPEDVFRLKLAGLLAELEVAKMSMRQKRVKGEAAALGAPHGGKRRFGYEADGLTIREDEAAAIRVVAAKVLNGETLASCARWLTAEGFRMTGPNLGTLLKRAYLAGLRVYQGEVIGEAAWAPVIDVATREALLVKLGDPGRRVSFTNARVYLLAGLALCGECGAKLRGRQGGARADRASYSCPECHGVHREVARVDERVTAWVVAQLARLDVRGMLAADDEAAELAELTARRRDLDARAAELEDEYDAGNMSAAAYARRTARDEAKAAELDRAIKVAEEALRAPVRALDGLTGPDPREVFTGLPLARQRAVIDLLATVHVDKATRKGASFDPESVRIVAKAG